MKSTYKFVFRIAIIAITAVLFCSSSCEKPGEDTNVNNRDANPYSETRNESLSMLGFSWNGARYIQYTKIHLMSTEPYIGWNSVEIDKEDFIIIHSPFMTSLGRVDIHIPEIWLFFPYQDIALNEKYTTSKYSSFACFTSNSPFVINGKECNSVCVPLTITVEYSKIGSRIQGKFIAEGGSLETSDGKTISIVFDDGVFNLSNTKGLAKSYTLEKWLKEIEQAKQSYR